MEKNSDVEKAYVQNSAMFDVQIPELYKVNTLDEFRDETSTGRKKKIVRKTKKKKNKTKDKVEEFEMNFRNVYNIREIQRYENRKS